MPVTVGYKGGSGMTYRTPALSLKERKETRMDKYWLRFWILVGIVLMVLSVCITASSMYANCKKAEIIMAGASPIEAKFAFSASGTSSETAILVSKIAK